MANIISGRVCARPCKGLEVPISNGTVLFYRSGTGKPATREEIASRALDDNGEFEDVSIPENVRPGEAIIVDIRLKNPVADEADTETVQATIATIEFAEADEKREYDWCLTRQQYCKLMEELGVWYACGQVTNCDTEEPLEGMLVTAFDADIVQHDTLGADTTDANGWYFIYYTRDDFEKTPAQFAPIELVGGPDLYFTIESEAGTLLLEEEPSDGRQPGRENVGHCHCEDFCVDFEDSDPPLFTHVGEFNIFQDLETNGTLNKSRYGLGGDGWGFFGSIPLEGYVPEKHPESGEQMWYRFLYHDSDGNEHPLVGNLVDRVSIGGKLVPTGAGPFGLGWKEYFVVGSEPTPDPSLDPEPEFLEPTSGSSDPNENGWVPVPDLIGSGLGHGPLMRFDTRNAPTIPGGPPSVPTPGEEVTPTPSGEKIEVIFETTTTDSINEEPTPTSSHIERQDDSATLYVNNYGEVRTLDVTDENGNLIGCDVAEGAVVRYTADHEFLHSYSVSLKSQAAGGGGPGSTWPKTLESENMDRGSNLPGTETGNEDSIDLPAVYDGGTGTPGSDYDAFADWPSCSYIAHLRTRRALTNGIDNDDHDRTGAVNGVFYKG